MTPRPRTVQVTVGLALAIGAAATWLARSAHDAQPAPSPSGEATLQWRAGTVQEYRLATTSTVHIGGDVTAPEPIVQELRGVLAFRTLECSPEAATVGMRLDPVELLIGGVSDADVTRALTAPFRVLFAPDGTATFVFAMGVDPTHAALIEETVRTFQMVVRGGPEWTADEAHATGRYTALYSRTDATHVHRRKLRYSDPGATDGRKIDVRSSSATAFLAPHADWLAGMKVEETLATRDPSGVAFEVTTRASLELLAGPTAAVGEVAAWSFGPATARDHAPQDERVATPPVSTEQLAAELDELLVALDTASTGRVVWIHRLRDLLRGDARAAALLLDAMRQRAFVDRTRADLFLALELGGTEPAQQALARVVGQRDWSHRDRLRATIALGGVAAPTRESLQSLWMATRERTSAEQADAANTALLALGAAGARLAGINDAAYAELRGGLLVEASAASHPSERSTAILALANTGDHSLAKELSPFLDDAAPEVRVAAAKAIGKLDGDAPVVFALRLPHEANSAVRATMAAALAAASPPPDAMVLVRERILAEPDERTRLELARCLGRNLTAQPENAAALRTLFASETSARIRRCVGETLALADAAAARAQDDR